MLLQIQVLLFQLLIFQQGFFSSQADATVYDYDEYEVVTSENYGNSKITYNRPGCKGWPTEEQWNNDLRYKLSDPTRLLGPFYENPAKVYQEYCLLPEQVSSEIFVTGQGLCMENHACANYKCVLGSSSAVPAYSVEAVTVEDIQVAMRFVSKYNIPVAVKSSGHSFQAQSMQTDALLIWLRSYQDYNFDVEDNSKSITTNYVDSCGTEHGPTIHLVAGQNFDTALENVKEDYLLVTGICRTVSITGGWLQGGGISFLSRNFGYGVDQVRSFDVVLADGSLVKADACTNADLFWALRGGGGGNYGVVTAVEYQLYPNQLITEMSIGPSPGPVVGPIAQAGVSKREKAFLREYMSFLVYNMPDLGNEWLGAWLNIRGGVFYFLGTQEEFLQNPFTIAFDAWREDMIARGILSPEDEWYSSWPRPSTKSRTTTWYQIKGGEEEYPFEGGETSAIPPALGRPYSRFIAKQAFKERPEELIDALMFAGLKGNMNNIYFLGAKTAEIPKNATAIHPGAREVVFGVNVLSEIGNKRLLLFAGESAKDWSVSYNHHDSLEKNWEEVLFGPQYDRLSAIKKKYDPYHRFNVYHGVDHIPPDEMAECDDEFDINWPYIPKFMRAFVRQVLGFLG